MTMEIKILASSIVILVMVLVMVCCVVRKLQKELGQLHRAVNFNNSRDVNRMVELGQQNMRLESKINTYKDVMESVLKQEVEIRKGINATNEKLLDIISAAGEIERGRAEIALMYESMDKRYGLIEEDIKRVYGRLEKLENAGQPPKNWGIDWGKPIDFTCSEGLTPEEIRALGRELGVIDVDSVTKNLHEKCNTAEEVGECTGWES